MKISQRVKMLWLRLMRWLGILLVQYRRQSHGRRQREIAPTARGIRKPDWVIRRVIHLKALMPEAGCRRIADSFNREHCAAQGLTIGKSFVADTLRRHRYAVEQERRRIRRRSASLGARNITWAIDMTGKRDASGRTHQILGLIDHGTRLLLALEPVPVANSWTLLGHLCLAIARYGRPRALRRDNASVFTSGVFRAGVAVLGIRHQRSEIGCPWQNGRIERLFGTLKAKLDRWQVMDLTELGSALELFRFWCNAIRPHQNLAGRTPLEAWKEIDPRQTPPRRIIRFSAWDGLLTGNLLLR